ncbi:ABC transporter substrate-binding protein [Peptoniphilus sp. GNH]|nr:ABC transporter substrate-binding protein [Peptoniphilus sp. GNH]
MKIKKLALVAMSAILLTACTGTQKGEKKEDGNKKASSDTIRVSMFTEIDSLNPFTMTAGDTETIMDNVFDGLYDTDEKGELVPDLAESYKVSEDGKTYTFQLKKGVKFHNGKELKAEDVVWTYDQLAGITSKEPKNSKFSVVESVKALDDYTVEVGLKERFNGFIYLTLKPIMPKDYMDQDKNPVGTGPFKFVSYNPGEILKLERNEDYHRKDHIPSYKNLEIIKMKDVQTVIMALKSGEIDVSPKLSAEEKAQLEGAASFVQGLQNLVQVIGLNNKVKPFDDIRVRQAVNYAIDRDQIIKIVAHGQATKLFSSFSPALPRFFNDLGELYPHDVEKAKALLKEAGYENGIDMNIVVPSNYKYHMDTAEVLESQLKEAGIRVTIEPIEFETWIPRCYKGRDFQATIIGFIGYMDPHQILQRYMSDNKSNYINYNNPEYDKVMKEAATSPDEEGQIKGYKAAQEIIAKDAGSVFIQDPDSITALRKGVEGLKHYPIQKMNLEDLRITN